jgi:hypothetical protein
MTAAIGCAAPEVFPHGNLMIRGQREIQGNGEIRFIKGRKYLPLSSPAAYGILKSCSSRQLISGSFLFQRINLLLS